MTPVAAEALPQGSGLVLPAPSMPGAGPHVEFDVIAEFALDLCSPSNHEAERI